MLIPKKKVIVISGINLIHGGPFTVFREFIKSTLNILDEDWEIIVLCSKPGIVCDNRIKFIEFPCARKSWLLRLYYEWINFYFLSKKLNADIWISMSDISPNVIAKRKLVYLHNPSPFYSMTIREIYLEPKLFLFNLFYMYLYRINLKSNNFIVVQQNWIRNEFSKYFDRKNIIVSHPRSISLSKKRIKTGDKINFLYPAVPRVFKNFELICRAVQLLDESTRDLIRVYLTIDGSENKYAREIVDKFKYLECVRFIGYQNQNGMKTLYQETDVLLFPSKLETWGLPISEAVSLEIPILAADLPYARETAGSYSLISFLSPIDEGEWMVAISKIVKREWTFTGNFTLEPFPPFAGDWDSLIRLITSK